MKHRILAVLHAAAFIAILLLSLICADIVSNALSVNVILDGIIYTAVYIAVTLTLGLLYAKYILHFTVDEIGAGLKLPELKWIIAGILLPVSVTAFYLVFTDGQLVKSDNGAGLAFFLVNAICPVGIAAGVCEEFIFRGLIMRTLERAWNRTSAVLVPSVFFALLHMTNMRLGFLDMLLLLVGGTAVGVMFSLIALQSGTIWSGVVVHALWNIIIVGSILMIESPAYGITANCFYRYELLSDNVLLTGGRFGIESALPAIIGYCIMSAIALILLKRQTKIKK